MDGPLAVNATACVQPLDQREKRCDITITCLRGKIGPQYDPRSPPRLGSCLYTLSLAGE
jgi:hypothetical protein